MSNEEKPESESPRKEYVIDLNKIEDRLPTNWWNKLDPYTFGFWTKLPLISYCRVKDKDILIQKQKRDEDRFITVHYYQVIDGKVEQMGMDNNRVKSFLSTTLLDYIMKNKQLPFSCRYVKEFVVSGNVQIDFTPTKWDNYAIHIMAKSAKLLYDIDDLMEVVHDLKPVENNPAIKRKKTAPVQGIKRLTKEEYKKKMQKIDENEYFSELMKPETESDPPILLPQKSKEQQIADILAKLDADDTPIQKPKEIPKPVLKTVDTDQFVAFIKSNDKGEGVHKTLIMDKFGLDIPSFMKNIDILMNKLLIYKVKPNFYASY